MPFHLYISESLKNTNLRRIRIKTDPSKVKNNEDFKNIEGYEGYILGESKGFLKILILTPDMPLMDVPPEIIEHINDEHNIDYMNNFKEFCKKYLETHGTKTCDPIFKNIDNSNNFNDVEIFLKQHGLNNETLLEIYKGFLENE